MSDRSIYWSVTINNPREDDDENIACARQRGWVVEGQKEVGENGTPHYQLIVNTKTQQRFTALKKMFPRAHIEAARKPTALKQYVHKEETRVAELPNSEKYITSQRQLWDLVVDMLETDDAAVPKRYRIQGGESYPYDKSLWFPLDALDFACDQLIRRGYYCVETMAVNPQTRSAFQKFWSAIIARRQQDRQTDRQNDLISQEVDIPEYAEEVRQDQGEEGTDYEGDDYSSGEEDETDSEGLSDDSGEESY